MTARFDHTRPHLTIGDGLITADASQMSPLDFFRALQGKPPLTPEEQAEKKRLADEYWEKRKAENRREIERIRDNLCNIASPKLAAEMRAQWAEEDRRQA